jgi:hypothetical protein
VNAISDALNRVPVSFTCSQILFFIQPGDAIPINRTRFPDASGTASGKEILVESISKDMAARRTVITGRIL